MSTKYDPLRSELDSAPADEAVSFTFSELEALVGGLPRSARVHRSWWGNTFSHNRPHALAWMELGRRVTEVRLDDAVVFSPADAPTEGPSADGRPTALRAGPWQRAATPVLDGVRALAVMLNRAGYESVSHAVAAHAVFLHPDTVAQAGGKALFRIVRDPTRRGTFGALGDGTPVLFDDNRGPTLGFLWAAQRAKGPDVQLNHIWGDPKNVNTYTALWNVCVTPAFLAKTTDGANHAEVVNLLRYRAFDLYGHVPAGEGRPDQPLGYEQLRWAESPSPVDDLEGLLRRHLGESPKSSPAISARGLGWAFSDGPDVGIPEA